MHTLPQKPPSSRRDRERDNHRRSRYHDRDRDRDRDRNGEKARDRDRKAKDKDRDRDRDGDRARDRDRNHHRTSRHSPSRSPLPSHSSKRPRYNDKGKGKEPPHNGDTTIKHKSGEIGDDFIPFGVSDGEDTARAGKPRSGKGKEKERTREREWDAGKSLASRGSKRKHDDASDDEDVRWRPRFESRMTPWVSHVDWDSCHNVAEMLHREVEAFVRYMSPTPVEDEIRGLTIQLVSDAITSAFSDARILPFGSYETKLYLPSGDIDLVVESVTMARSNKINVLRALANTVKRAGITSKVTVISRAKVPIVKFVTHFGRLNVDISVNQENGVKAGQIVNGFLQDMYGCGFALRCLIVIVKAFLNQRGMNEVYTGGLGSYSIVCLAISFLQMHPKIRRGEIEPEKNLGVLVMEFFELYGCYFSYEDVGISIRNGGCYFNKRQRGWYDSTRGLLLSIEDPIDISNDISKGSYGINKVRQTFAGAYGIMQATSFLRAGILSSRREGQSHRLRLVTNPEDMSILSSILGVTQEMINNRRLLQEVYDKRLLHKLLHVQPQASVVVADVPNGGAPGKSTVGVEWDEGPDEHAMVEQDSDESGRYDIGRRPGANGELAAYTTDEELSEEESSVVA